MKCIGIKKLQTQYVRKSSTIDKYKIIFHHDDAPVHAFIVVVAELIDLYSNLFDVPHFLQIWLHWISVPIGKIAGGKEILFNEDKIVETNANLVGLDQTYYPEGYVNPILLLFSAIIVKIPSYKFFWRFWDTFFLFNGFWTLKDVLVCELIDRRATVYKL